MNIISAKTFALNIPFTSSFSHRLKSRSSSDSVIVKVSSNTGVSGFGEGVPRPYVTGEDVASCLHVIEHVLIPSLFGVELPEVDQQNPVAFLAEISALLPAPANDAVIAFNAAKAAVELALIDVVLKDNKMSLGEVLPPKTDFVFYSAVISSGSIDATKKMAESCRALGISQIKIKVGLGNDYDRIAIVRDILGKDASLRLDANGAFDAQGILAFLSKIQPLTIESIEQPLPRNDFQSLIEVCKNSPIPIMADESLVTTKDAEELIKYRACNLFNLRISKNGGIYQVLRLADRARESDIGYQIGCQVGETGVLSAAGRHIAAYLGSARHVEGSYGKLLLTEDICEGSIQFGFGGRAPLLKEPGLGIQINERILEKHSGKIVLMKDA